MSRIIRLVVACVVVVGVAAACLPTSSPAHVGPSMTATERAISDDLMVRLNQERVGRGLAPLQYDAGLAARSADWSRTMPALAVTGTRLHHSDLNPLLGRFTAAAENVAWTGGGSAGLVHTSWMRSDGHRHNMLAPNVDVVGIAVFCAPGRAMWVTETFGRRPGAGGPAGFGPLPAVAPVVNPRTDGPTC